MSKDELSWADIKAVCTEAGMLELRERMMKVVQEDFVKAKEKEKALYRKKGSVPEGLYLNGYNQGEEGGGAWIIAGVVFR